MPQATRRGPQTQSKRHTTDSRRSPEDPDLDVTDIDNVDQGDDDDNEEETTQTQSNVEGQSQNMERVSLQLTYANK